jgi:flagellar hook-basal body complex protein FliE
MDSYMVDMLHFSELKKEEVKIAQPDAAIASGTISFEELLSSSMKRVNDLQLESDEMVQKLATGDVEDISEVVLASSRAEVALKMFMELRNKFLDAYQQLSRMSA